MNKSLKCIVVINNRHDGYRRAGLALKQGKNQFFELDAEQINALKSDPALTVTIEVENSNEDVGDTFGDTGSPTGKSGLGAGETGGKENTEETDGTNGESGAKTPEAPKSHLELSQAVVVALAESDTSVYFNGDGSPKITKWREVTGNTELTKGDVTEAIAVQTKE